MTVTFKVQKVKVSDKISEIKRVFDEYQKEWRKEHIDEPLPILDMSLRFIGARSNDNVVRTYKANGSMYQVEFTKPLLMDGSEINMNSRTDLVVELEDKLAEIMSTNIIRYEVICPYTDLIVGTVFLDKLTADIDNVMNESIYKELEMTDRDILYEVQGNRPIKYSYHSSVVNLMSILSSQAFDYDIIKYGLKVVDDQFDEIYYFDGEESMTAQVYLDEDGERYFLHKRDGALVIVPLESKFLIGIEDKIGTPSENVETVNKLIESKEVKEKNIDEVLDRIERFLSEMREVLSK